MKKRYGLSHLSYLVSFLTLGLFGMSSLEVSPAMADVPPIAAQKSSSTVIDPKAVADKSDSASKSQTIPSGAIGRGDSALTPATESSRSDKPSSGNSQASANTTTSQTGAIGMPVPEIGIKKAEIHRLKTAISERQRENDSLARQIEAGYDELEKLEILEAEQFEALAVASENFDLASAAVLAKKLEVEKNGGNLASDEEYLSLIKEEVRTKAELARADSLWEKTRQRRFNQSDAVTNLEERFKDNEEWISVLKEELRLILLNLA